MKKQYIEKRKEGYWIIGSRVSLESVIFAFLEGLSPETIASECFPTLTLEQVYGAITYYLANRPEMDSYLQQIHGEFESLRKITHEADPAFSKKLARTRRNLQKIRQ